MFSGFSALIYAQIFDITGSFAGCFYLIIGFYVVTLICSLVIVPMGRRSWGEEVSSTANANRTAGRPRAAACVAGACSEHCRPKNTVSSAIPCFWGDNASAGLA